MTRSALLLLLASAAFSQEVEIFDLLLKGGRVLDPGNKRDARLDIAISKGLIRKIAPSIPVAQARRVVDLSDYIVTPGLVDIHAHFDSTGSPLSLNPDHNALRNGVTTAVDAGSGSPAQFEKFKAKDIDGSTARVLAFLNIMDGAAPLSPEAAAAIVRKHPKQIVGIRVANPAGLANAVKAAELTKTVVLAELPSGALAQLRPGDIYTHLYGLHGPSLEDAREARKRGVLFDTGHGSDGFWFRVAAPAIKQGLLPDTISTDLDKNSVMLPRATMTNVMSKFLALGVPLAQAVERATILPAKAIGRPELGAINEGGPADLAVLELRAGPVAFLDSGHAKLTASQQIRAVMTIRNGAIVWDTQGLSLTHWKDAGPYSNFK